MLHFEAHSLNSGERKGNSPNPSCASHKNGGCKGITSGASREIELVELAISRDTLRGRIFKQSLVNQNTLERGTIGGNSPVGKNYFVLLVIFLEYLEK